MSCDDNVCGIPGRTTLPGDPSNNSILSATPAFGGIDLNWSFPTTNPFAVAHTRVFRAIIPDFSAALVIADPVGGSFYYDKRPPDIEYYYWIQFVSINGTYGDPIGPASAAARPKIEEMIELLTGMIDAGFLAQSLKTQIADITNIDNKLLGEIADRIAANQALNSALDAVHSDVGAAVTLISQEVVRREADHDALVTSINSMAAGVNGNAAAIIEERNLRVTDISAVGQRIDTLYVEVGVGTDQKVAAAVLTESQARATADQAVSARIDTVFAQVGPQIGAAVQAETNARATAVDQVAQSVVQLQTKMGQDIQAAVSAEQTARTNADGAIATSVANLQTKMGQDIAAAVLTETNARSSAVDAVAGQITTAQSNLNGTIAQVQQNMQTKLDATNGNVQGIGALYTVKTNVNGLIGGFGTYNDGNTVQMGFDVDTFWVGRTGANMRKPFIIQGAETFIDQAVINQLTFSKLRAEDGSVIVQDGKLKAAYIQADQIVAKQIDLSSGGAGAPRVTMTNSLIQVFHANGNSAVKLGIW